MLAAGARAGRPGLRERTEVAAPCPLWPRQSSSVRAPGRRKPAPGGCAGRLKPPEAGEIPLGVGGAAGGGRGPGRGEEGRAGRGRGGEGARPAPGPAACTWRKLRTKPGLLGAARTVSPPLRPGPAKCTRGRTRSGNYRTRRPVSHGRRGGDEGGGRGAGPWRLGAARDVWPLGGRAGVSRSLWHRTHLSPSQESGLRGHVHSGPTTVKSQGRTGPGGRVEAGEAASPAGAPARAALRARGCYGESQPVGGGSAEAPLTQSGPAVACTLLLKRVTPRRCPGASREERLVGKRLLQARAVKGSPPRANVTAPGTTGRKSTGRLRQGADSAAGCQTQKAGLRATAAVQSQRPPDWSLAPPRLSWSRGREDLPRGTPNLRGEGAG